MPKRILSYILYFLSIYNTWNSQLIYNKNNFPMKDIKIKAKQSFCVCVLRPMEKTTRPKKLTMSKDVTNDLVYFDIKGK